MLVLGIESSCDETAVAVVRDGREVLSNIILSQVDVHRPYGGVVPEIASRAHVEAIGPVIEAAMQEAQVDWTELDQIAVTHGPGLASSLLIGVTAAQALAARLDVPLFGINHLAGHLYSVCLDPQAPPMEERYPLIVLLVTGGNTMLMRVDGLGRETLLGQTIDDAIGEALDKGATLMGLGYPGGPEIERAAQGGDPRRHEFPRGLRGGPDGLHGGLPRDRCFSFSGLKTALLYTLRDHPEYCQGDALADLAASYQEAAFDALIDRVERVLLEEGVPRFACVGGVAKNQRLRAKLDALAKRHDCAYAVAPMAYCTDNAAMIAGLAGALTLAGHPPVPVHDVHPSLPLRPRTHQP